MSALTAGGALQGGLMLGGSMLAMDGWNRGGAAGMAEMTGGGAAIGMSLGGPLGAPSELEPGR
jgi:hypothetical protein